MTSKQAILTGNLDETMSFHEKVWALTARIPKGRVATYGDIANALGTQAYRAVGQALNKNPYAPAVPCHRVVGSTGDLTGFASGVEKKRRLLTHEHVPMRRGRVSLSECRFTF